MARTLFRELAEIVRLEKGRHRRPQDGVCTMELVAWMSGEKHSDRPKSASPPAAPRFSRLRSPPAPPQTGNAAAAPAGSEVASV